MQTITLIQCDHPGWPPIRCPLTKETDDAWIIENPAGKPVTMHKAYWTRIEIEGPLLP